MDFEVAAEGGAMVDPGRTARAGKRLLIAGDAQRAAYLPDWDGKGSGIRKPSAIMVIPAL